MKNDELLGVMYTTDGNGICDFQVSYNEELSIMHYFLNDEQIYEEADYLTDEEIEALKDKEDNAIQDSLFDYYYSEYVSKCSDLIAVLGYDLEF